MRLPVSRGDALKWSVWDRDQGVCGICAELVLFENFEPDHIIPQVDGGIDCLDNLRAAHSWCNRARGAQLGKERQRAGLGRGRYESPAPNCGNHCGVFAGIGLTADLLRWIAARAESEHRTIPGQIVHILEQVRAAHG